MSALRDVALVLGYFWLSAIAFVVVAMIVCELARAIRARLRRARNAAGSPALHVAGVPPANPRQRMPLP